MNYFSLCNRILIPLLMGLSISVSAAASGNTGKTYISGTASQFEEAKTKEWIAETYSILESSKFHENLLRIGNDYPNIWFSPFLELHSPKELSNLIKLKSVKHPDAWRVPSALALSGFPLKDTNAEDGYGIEGDRYAGVGWTGYSVNSVSTAAMRIGRVHFDRFTSSDIVERSCAINTLAHEISHTYSRYTNQYVEFILDTANKGAQHDGTPLASYFIGSVAQCTYLENEGRISTKGLLACVRTFGLTRYNNNRCNDFSDSAKAITP